MYKKALSPFDTETGKAGCRYSIAKRRGNCKQALAIFAGFFYTYLQKAFRRHAMSKKVFRAINSTLIYVERGDEYLMLHRTKKENDLNHDKWIGIGGKFEENESPEDCMLREAREETGLTLTSWRYRGIVTFLSDRWETEYMHLFTADGYSGTLRQCDEGDLAWIKKSELLKLRLWEGDKIFLRLLDSDEPFFSLKLKYEGDTLVLAVLNGKRLEAGNG